MDNKNVFVAIALSMSVLLFWGAFFETPNKQQKNISENQNQLNRDTKPEPVPNLETVKNNFITRSESIKESKRVEIENKNLKGSLSLEGAVIDDISFKNYKKNVLGEENIIFLNPKGTEKANYIESGWVSSKEEIKVPNLSSNWKLIKGEKLSLNNSIILEWDNGQNIIFRKEIFLDDKFLFKVRQEVINKTKKDIKLYPYAQITRNKKPDDYQGFFIMHEGFIAVLDGELKEDDYDDIEDKKVSRESSNGWIGITDKYWMSALVPKQGNEFTSNFTFNKNYRANYISNSPITVKANNKSDTEVKIFVAAKEVNTIDEYAISEKIEKFDLIIDWGWFYFFTKPLFFIVDYLFKFSGNFGIAIVLITFAIRIIFFPLASYSFRSMAKMKALQPELTRLKELHKEDKVKLQQEMMGLYRKEKINPASGCLPILIQIPFFFAIYKMLFISLEMRHQPFFGWIKDLSAQDPTSIFNLFGIIPWDPPGFLIIGAWPILMGLTMYIQQKLNPAPTDPIQAKIFMFFPLFLTIILASFPSGLVVYWTVNNILTIGQQWLIMKKTKIKTN